MTVSIAEIFAAMREAVTGEDGRALKRKFKVYQSKLFVSYICESINVHAEHAHVYLAKFYFDPSTQLYNQQGIVVFIVSDADRVITLDLKSSNPTVREGSMDDADLTVEVLSEDLIKLVTGELKPQQAFMKGILKIKGKMNLAMKLTSVLVATKKKLPRNRI